MATRQVSAGDYRNYVNFEKREKAPDEGGGRTGRWVPVLSNVPCAIRPASSREVTIAAQRQLQIDHAIETRYITGLKSEWRIVWPKGNDDGITPRYFSIEGTRNPDERRRVHLIECMERLDKDFQ